MNIFSFLVVSSGLYLSTLQGKSQVYVYMHSCMLTYLCMHVWFFFLIKNWTAREEFVAEDIIRSCMFRMIGNQWYSVWRDKIHKLAVGQEASSDILLNRNEGVYEITDQP